MGLITEIIPFKHTTDNLKLTVSEIERILPYNVNEPLTELHTFRKQKESILVQYLQLSNFNETKQEIEQPTVDRICHLLDKVVEELQLFDVVAANKIVNLRLRWYNEDPQAWYEKGKLLFQMFVKREIEDLEEVVSIFSHVIEITENTPSHHELTFWSYSFMGNLYLYRILTGQEALEHAFKYYNEAYRFAQEHRIDVEDSFILENVEILSQILMNQYPLLIVVYNNSGMKIYEYLFQFIEVITEDQRFIPNFTALLSAVDSRIEELFNSPISSSYIVIENRLMVITTLHDFESDDWIKVAMVFSYLHQSAYNVEVDKTLLEKAKEFNDALLESPKIKDYILNFYGKIEEDIYELINEKIKKVFSDIQDRDY